MRQVSAQKIAVPSGVFREVLLYCQDSSLMYESSSMHKSPVFLEGIEVSCSLEISGMWVRLTNLLYKLANTCTQPLGKTHLRYSST